MRGFLCLRGAGAGAGEGARVPGGICRAEDRTNRTDRTDRTDRTNRTNRTNKVQLQNGDIYRLKLRHTAGSLSFTSLALFTGIRAGVRGTFLVSSKSRFPGLREYL
jgi:hypothetical protein